MNKLTLLLSVLLCLMSYQGMAQNETGITGKVYSNEGEALSYANVVLYNQSDSSLAKAEHTQDDGSFLIQGVKSGNYYLQISYLGLHTLTKSDLLITSGYIHNLGTIELSASGIDLSEIVVSTSRPLIEIKADRTIFNVDASVTAAGSDGFDLLRKAPGIVIDNNDNIQMLGKSGVLVYLDGKQSYLSAQELANLLRSLNASDIEAIEIITNPSARFDASGNAGIINLVFKKDKGLGTNGTLNYSAAYGLQFRTNASVNLNHRSKNFNIYGSTGLGLNNLENGMKNYRMQNDKIFDQQQTQVNTNYPINARMGLDYFINQNHTFGLLANTFTNIIPSELQSHSRTLISNQATPDLIDSILIANNTMELTRLNANFNLNYRYADTEKGREFTVDIDRGIFRATTESYQPNTYFLADEQSILKTSNFLTNAPSDIDILSFKADYEQKLWSSIKMIVGLKWSSVSTDNTFEFYKYDENGQPVRDPSASNHFAFQEKISSAYANFNGNINPTLSYQAGLRMEHTESIGNLTRDPGQEISPDDYVKRYNSDFFPSAAITWQLQPKHTLNATYSRRINRPNYQQLNPFEWRFDELTYRKGSPFLNPQYSHAFEMKYIGFQMVNLSIGYTKTQNMITNITEPSQTEPNKSYMIFRNLASQDHFSAGVNSPTPINKWWNGYFSLSAYKSFFKADFDAYQFELASPLFYNIYAEQSFTIRKGTTFEVSGWYSSGAVWGGSSIAKPRSNIDLGVQQRIFNDKGTLKLSVTDILDTASWQVEGDVIPGFTVISSGYWDSRQIRLNFNYRFGNMEVKSARQRRTGNESESERIG